MKKLLHFALALTFLLALSAATTVRAQGQLSLTNLYNFPDTAFEGVQYNGILAVVTNVGNSTFSGNLGVSLMSDSLTDILVPPSGNIFTILPGDSVTLQAPTYFFNSSIYKVADNIVVVWPVANVAVADSFFTNVHFVPLSKIKNNDLPVITLSPNPSKGEIKLGVAEKISPEQVSVFTAAGNVVRFKLRDNILSLPDNSSGIFVIRIKLNDGMILTRKIILLSTD